MTDPAAFEPSKYRASLHGSSPSPKFLPRPSDPCRREVSTSRRQHLACAARTDHSTFHGTPGLDPLSLSSFPGIQGKRVGPERKNLKPELRLSSKSSSQPHAHPSAEYGRAGRIYCEMPGGKAPRTWECQVLAHCRSNKSPARKKKNTTEITPFIVKKAALSFVRSVGETRECS
jgi:hypothetical protein